MSNLKRFRFFLVPFHLPSSKTTTKGEKQRIKWLFKCNGEWKEKRRISRYSFFLRWFRVKNYECDLHLRSREVLKQEWHPPHHNQPLSFPTLFMCVGTVYVYRESRFFYFRLFPLMFPPSVSRVQFVVLKVQEGFLSLVVGAHIPSFFWSWETSPKKKKTSNLLRISDKSMNMESCHEMKNIMFIQICTAI